MDCGIFTHFTLQQSAKLKLGGGRYGLSRAVHACLRQTINDRLNGGSTTKTRGGTDLVPPFAVSTCFSYGAMWSANTTTRLSQAVDIAPACIRITIAVNLDQLDRVVVSTQTPLRFSMAARAN